MSGKIVLSILVIQIIMDIQSSSSNKSPKQFNSSSKHSKENPRNFIAMIDSSFDFVPYRSKFELNSIASGKSRESRDSDLLNRLAKQSSHASSKSLSRNASERNLQSKSSRNQNDSSYYKFNTNSCSEKSQKSIGQIEKESLNVQSHVMAPKIHNCFCFAAGQCLSYNCNCFLSPFPCAPDCCPNCLTLKTNLPHKTTNLCSCKKTKCLRLYCECLSRGEFCGVMCRCEMCQNHQYSESRMKEICFSNMHKGCACQKSSCQKKYCYCFANKLKCTTNCGCIDCHNMLKVQQLPKTQPQQRFAQKMDVQYQQPEMEFEEINFFGTRKR